LSPRKRLIVAAHGHVIAGRGIERAAWAGHGDFLVWSRIDGRIECAGGSCTRPVVPLERRWQHQQG